MDLFVPVPNLGSASELFLAPHPPEAHVRYLTNEKCGGIPGTRAPSVLLHPPDRAPVVAVFGYIHEAEG